MGFLELRIPWTASLLTGGAQIDEFFTLIAEMLFTHIGCPC